VAVRIGIHTGLVVVGQVGGGTRPEQLALGDTPNIAARLQGLAAPDTVVCSAATFRLVRGYFTYEDLGAHALKGVAAPVQVYRILGESAAQSRLDVAQAVGFTPLVGRESEVALLLERWAQSQDGRGQVVLLRGEAGIGKSRLVEVVRERARQEGATRTAFRCSPYYQQSALYPLIDHLQRVLQWQRDASPEAKFDALERVLRTYRLSLEEVIPLFATLLSVPLPERYPPLTLPPAQQRQKTHEALIAWLLEETERQPVLAVWEDLHWADPSTLEHLSLVLDQAPTARMLTLLTCRPEFHPPWAAHVPVTQVTLTRLGRPQVEAMILHLTGGKALPAEVVQQIVAKTDGVPLFVEELVKMVLESGLVRKEDDRYVLAGPLPPLAIPSTLHDSLMARLDRLSAARDLAQLGAVLGREFSYDVLQAVSPLDEMTLQHGLAQLLDAELLYQRGLPPRSRYVFKHALIQDAAYQSLLKSTRQQYHQRIAQALEARFPEAVETHPELVAQHYTEAGLHEQAVTYWQRAGTRALQRSANAEAIAHCRAGLELLPTLPQTTARLQEELALQVTLGPALIATKGHAAPEVEQTYTRARELCQQVGETPQLFRVLRGLWLFYNVRAAHETARELGEQCLRWAQQVHDPALLLEAHRPLGITLFCLGEIASARAHLEQGIALYDPQQHRSHAFHYSIHPGMACCSYAAWALWLLGYAKQALQRSQEAILLAQEHPLSLAQALSWAAWLHQLRREPHAAKECAERAMALCSEQRFPYFLAWGTILQGWALAAEGQGEAGMAQMRQGLAAHRATGAEEHRPFFLALLAEAYGRAGQVEEGLSVLTEALAAVDKTGEHVYEAELYRLKGELLQKQATAMGAVEECVHHAVSVAHQQSAKSLELRAVMSLSRLLMAQGKTAEARQMLTEIYAWFTEGFDTADLQEAKALLEVRGDYGEMGL
jgi:predicted ATPase